MGNNTMICRLWMGIAAVAALWFGAFEVHGITVDPSLLTTFGWNEHAGWGISHQGACAQSLLNNTMLLYYGGREQVSSGLSASALKATDENVYYLKLPSNASGTLPMIAYDGTPGARFMAASFQWGTGDSAVVVGGYEGDQGYRADVWRADAAPFAGTDCCGQWRPAVADGDAPAGRYGHAAALVQYDDATGRGFAVVLGGIGSGGTVFDDAWVLLLEPTGRAPACNASLLPANLSLDCAAVASDLQDLNATWWALPLAVAGAPAPGGRAFAAAAALGAPGRLGRRPDGAAGGNSSCMYLTGGYNYVTSTYYDEIWKLCSEGPITGPDTNFTWTQLAPNGTAPSARYGHAVIAGPTPGRFFLFGGSSKYPDSYVSDSFEYDEELNAWLTVNLQGDAVDRRSHSLALLNGSVAVLGGNNQDQTLAAVRLANWSAPLCPDGYIMELDTDAILNCTECEAGSYSLHGAYHCTACPAGSYNPSAASANCTLCPVGTYNANAGSSSAADCQSCPSGESTAAAGSASADDCVGCAAGYYESGNACLECSAGTYSTGSATGCSTCSPGYYSLAGWSNCTECPAGKFSSNSSSASCDICPKGYYSNSAAAACTPCPAGSYNPSAMGATAAACLTCPAGYYCPGTGRHEGVACPEGTANPDTGGTALGNCTACPQGTAAAEAGQAACANCSAGTYQESYGQTSCDNCPENTYSTIIGATNSSVCTDCPSGYTSSAGAGSLDGCAECQPGTYANSPSEGPGCSDCQRGRYTDSVETAAGYNCTLCPPNTYQENTGQSSCIDCADGYYSFNGYTRCVPCNGSADCPLGPNGRPCSGAGACSYIYGACDCDDGFDGLDCSRGYGDGSSTGVVGFARLSQRYTGYEGDTFQLALRRRVGLAGPLTVYIDVVAGGSATSGADYGNTSFPVEVIFSDGEDEAYATIPILDDSTLNEPCEYLNLTIIPGISAVSHSGIEDLAPNATVYINEDDYSSAILASTSYDASVTGGLAYANLTVLLGEDNYTLSLDMTATTDAAQYTSLDLLFLVDFSYGMNGYINKLINNVDSSLILVENNYYDVHYGLASFSDKPLGSFGTNGSDVEFQINAALQSGSDTYSSALSQLKDQVPAASTGDDENSALTALLQVAAQSESVGWRQNAYKVVVLVSEYAFHESSDCMDSGDCTSENNLDSVVDTTEDYPSIKEVAVALENENIIPIFMVAQGDRDTYATIGEIMNNCYQDKRLINNNAVYTKVIDALDTLEEYICPSVVEDEMDYVVSLTADSSHTSVSAGDTVTYSLLLNANAATSSSILKVAYRGNVLPIDLERQVAQCNAGEVAASGGASYVDGDRARDGALQGFRSDEALDWGFGTAGGEFYIDTVEGPFGLDTEALNMTPCSGGVCAVMEAQYSFSPTYENNIPLVVKAHSRPGPGAAAAAALNYSVALAVDLANGQRQEQAVVLTFNASSNYWQYQYGVFYPNYYQVERATVTVTFSGIGSVLWTGVGLYGRSVEGCMCSDGYYVNAWTTAARLCNPKPSCRYDDGVSECTRCTPGYACKAGRLEPCTGTDYAAGGSAECSSCRDGWLCENGLTTPCERLNKISNGTACVECPEGHWHRNGIAYECPKGKFSVGGEAANQCVACAPGQVANATGLAACAACPAGTTSNQGRSACMACPAGESTGGAAGAHPCAACAPGTHAPEPGGAARCTPCPVGYYTEDYGSAECLECPGGTSTATAGANSSALCV